MGDWKEVIKMTLLVIIAATTIYGTFIKKQKTRIIRQGPPSATATIPPSPPQSQAQNNDLSLTLDPNQEEGSSNNFMPTTIDWISEKHDFGNIKQHTENNHTFKFTNTGTEPLIIENAQGSCGCTVPDYPKEPIMPGEEGEIKVKYSPGTQIGQQQKTVAITANTEPKVFNLLITANVEEAPEPVLNE